MSNPLTGFSLHKIAYNSTPNILQLYLNERGYLLDSDFIKIKDDNGIRNYADIITGELNQIIKNDKNLLGELIKIFVISKRNALLGLLHNMEKTIEQDVLDYVNTLSSNYDRSIILLMRCPEVFRKYYSLYTISVQSEKYWSVRDDYVPSGALALTEEDISKLELSVKNYLPKEARENKCKCEAIEYCGRQYIFLITGDLPKHEEIWEADEVTGITINPIYKIAIVYDYNIREVDVYCRDKKTRTAIHKIFAQEKFQKEIPDNSKNSAIYSIESVIQTIVKNKKFIINIPTDSLVRDIWINSISFFLQKHNGKFAVESKTNTRKKAEGQFDHIYILLSKFIKMDSISDNSILIDDVKAGSIQFFAEYKDIYDGSIHKKSFTFSGKDNTNLGHNDIDREIKKCLIEGGYIKRNHIA